MVRLAVSTIIVVAIVCMSCLPSLAWDETGHKITAYIAWQRMTPDVRDRVIKLMLAAPAGMVTGFEVTW